MSETMLPRERFAMALDRKPLSGRVPHFELVFFLTMETLGKMRAVFKKDGTVTAGNASGINDGAAFMVLTNSGAEDDRLVGIRVDRLRVDRIHHSTACGAPSSRLGVSASPPSPSPPDV
mgnify:CR=1 FL=1